MHFRDGGKVVIEDKTEEDDGEEEDPEEDSLKLDLQSHLSLLESDPKSFRIRSPKSYYKLATKWANGQFFVQIEGTLKTYNLDMRVRLYSKQSEIVSTEPEGSVSADKYGEEGVRHEHVCKIRPGDGKMGCSYLVATE